ncbi:MAG: enolase C-terminal domain-like protein [Betaproteobacteria bacterium]
MKISSVSVLEYSRQLDGRSWNPTFRWTERRAPLVVIEADNGQAGVGEAWCRQQAIGAILAHLVAVVAPRLPGVELAAESIDCIVDSVRATGAPSPDASRTPWLIAAAASAIDIALWDLVSRSRGLPLWRALGGTSARVRVYASGGLYRDGEGVDELAAEVRGYVESGFRAVKMKVGALPLLQDLERVRAVRAAVGAEVELWVDAVNQSRRENAIAMATAMADAGANAIQAPVPFDDIAAMARINAECLPVVAGEAEQDMAGFERLLANEAVTLLQPNLGLCGGLSGGTRIAALGRSRSIDNTPQTFGTAVLQAASLHWGAATGGVHSVEYHRFHDHLAALLSPGSATVADGCVHLDDESGLGIAVPAAGPQADGGRIRCVRRVTL